MVRLSFFLCFSLVFMACAPQIEIKESSQSSSKPTEQLSPQEPILNEASAPHVDPTVSTPSEPLETQPVAEPAPPAQQSTVPDWKQRYEDLQVEYRRKFLPPRVGQPVRLQLASGRQTQGILEGITENDLQLQISQGSISYPKEALHPISVKDFYAEEFAEYYALQQATAEYNVWLRQQQPTVALRPQPTASRSNQPWPPQSRQSSQDSSPASEERVPMFPIPPELLRR